MELFGYIIAFLSLFGAYQIYASVKRFNRKRTFRHWDLKDANNQLRFVTEGDFYTQRLMNKSEYRLYRVLEKWIDIHKQNGYRLFAQVSLGECLRSPNDNAYKSINSKRVDFLIINAYGTPLAAIEYQGSGHNQNNAEMRDAVKAVALKKAGVRYIEIFPHDTPEEITQKLSQSLIKGAVQISPEAMNPSAA